MVGAPDHSYVTGAVVLLCVVFIEVVVAFGRLDVGPSGTLVPLGLPVDVALVGADILTRDADSRAPVSRVSRHGNH
ncbi:hypothetical protein D3C73_1257920 [compost metagenome]